MFVGSKCVFMLLYLSLWISPKKIEDVLSWIDR